MHLNMLNKAQPSDPQVTILNYLYLTYAECKSSRRMRGMPESETTCVTDTAIGKPQKNTGLSLYFRCLSSTQQEELLRYDR